MLGQPGEPRSHEQRADGTPYRVTSTQGRRDGCVAAGYLTTLADPLHCRSALIRGESELSQVQSLPWRNRGQAAADHPTLQEPSTRGTESAVSIEDQDWRGGLRAHVIARLITCVAMRPRGVGERPPAAWGGLWSAQ